jgi:hypothetical protein
MEARAKRLARQATLMASCTILLACSVGGLIPSGKKKDSGPILDVLPGASVDEKGQLADPKFTFDPSDQQIAVVVQSDPASQIGNGPLTVTWSQLTFGGETELFTDTLQLEAGDRAWSIGKNSGSLMPGIYKVTASLGGETQDVYVNVAGPATAQAGTATVGAAQAAGGQPPAQGGSGTVPQSAFTQVPSSELPTGSAAATGNGCTLLLEESRLQDIVYSSDRAIAEAMLITCDKADLRINAAMSGTPQTVGVFHIPAETAAGAAPVWNVAGIDPCLLPAGSDLPDAHLTVSAEVTSGKAAGLSTQLDLKLGPDTLPPVLHVISNPARGSKVKPGDKITLTIDAKEPQPGGPWQTGMKDIQVFASPGGQVDDKPFQTAPRACGAKVKEVKPYKVTYTVPRDAPPQFDLCVSALDMVNPETTMCGTFFTGDVWTGTIETTTSGDYGAAGNCVDEKWKSSLNLVVGGDGRVAGTGTTHVVAPAKCSGLVANAYHTDATSGAFTVDGTFDGKVFNLEFMETAFDGSTPGLFNYSLLIHGKLPVPVTGKGSAGGDLTVPVPTDGNVATANAEHIVDLTCQDCK